MMKSVVIFAGLMAAVAGHAASGAEVKLESDRDRINYSIGYQLGGDLKKQGVGLNPAVMLKGEEDALAGTNPLLSPEEMRTTLVALKKKIINDEAKKREQYRSEGLDFLKANAAKEGVKSLLGGLQYKVLKEGKGKSPTLSDTVSVNYRGTLVDGSEFNSSYHEGKPAVIPLASTIPGWKEAIPRMKEGDRWLLFIPPDLAFGERGPLADRTVIYDIELVAVNPPPRPGN